MSIYTVRITTERGTLVQQFSNAIAAREYAAIAVAHPSVTDVEGPSTPVVLFKRLDKAVESLNMWIG